MEQYDYSNLFEEVLIVTDVFDKFTADFGWNMSKDYKLKIHKLQSHILKKADIAFASSKELYYDVKKVHPFCHYVPHGVDIDLYREENEIRHPIFKKLKRLRKPILGYLGTIQHKIDFKLLEYVCNTHPEWTLICVGREAINNRADMRNWRKLISRNNVYHLGEISRELIPFVLAYFDICLIPFKQIEWTRYGAPLKIWEYLAAGRPIVAIGQSIDDGCNNLISIVENVTEFEKAVMRILSEVEDIEKVKQRRVFANKNSWAKRVDKMMEILEHELAQQHKESIL